MSKTKTEQLEKLFNDWKAETLTWVDERPEDNYNKTFIKDGIIYEETFNKQPVKVLFISNEPNIDNEKINPEKDDDIRKDFIIYNEREKDEYYNDENGVWETSKGKMREKVCCLYQVITRDFTNAKKPWEEAQKFAFMNLNKTGGGAEIDQRIELFCKEFHEKIKEEIGIISPDLIVWLGTKTFKNTKIRKEIGVECKDGKYYFNGIPVIRMWHTSYYQAKCERLGKFENKIVDKLANKLSLELKNINWNANNNAN